MGLIQRGRFWWYRFSFNGQLIQESTKSTNKQIAQRAEEQRRQELRDALIGIDSREQRTRSIAELGKTYIEEFRIRRPKSATFGMYIIRHLTRLLGTKLAAQIDIVEIRKYQAKRLDEQAAPKTINDEVIVLLNMLGDRGDKLRKEMNKKNMRLKVDNEIGKAFSITEQDRLLAAAKESRSTSLYFAIELALNGGMRDAEIKQLKWSQIDFSKLVLTVGKAKSAAGTGRLVPLNGEIHASFIKHQDWYVRTFGDCKPDWYVFPFGRTGRQDPKRPVTDFGGAWRTARAKAGVTGRWHDTRHTVVTQLLESGASPATVMATVGHVSQRMLNRYSHANLSAQKRAMEAMVAYRNEQRKLEQEALAQLEKSEQMLGMAAD